MSRKGAMTARSRYRNPATLPGLWVELMFPPCKGLAGDTAKAVKMFRHTSKGGPCGAHGERLHPKPKAGVCQTPSLRPPAVRECPSMQSIARSTSGYDYW